MCLCACFSFKQYYSSQWARNRKIAVRQNESVHIGGTQSQKNQRWSQWSFYWNFIIVFETIITHKKQLYFYKAKCEPSLAMKLKLTIYSRQPLQIVHMRMYRKHVCIKYMCRCRCSNPNKQTSKEIAIIKKHKKSWNNIIMSKIERESERNIVLSASLHEEYLLGWISWRCVWMQKTNGQRGFYK